MTPIFSILAVLIAVVNIICGVQLYISYRKTKRESIGNFARVFLSVSLFWLFIAPAKLITTDLKLIQIFLDLSIFFGFLAGAFFLLIPFKTLYPKINPRVLFCSIVSLGIIFLVYNILNLKPALMHIQNNFIFWSENRSLLLDILSGSLFGIIGAIATVFFFQGGFKSSEKEIKSRAFLIGVSLFLIFLGAVIRFALSSLFNNIFISTLIAFILGGLFSSLLMIIAIFFIKPESKKIFYEKIYKEKE